MVKRLTFLSLVICMIASNAFAIRVDAPRDSKWGLWTVYNADYEQFIRAGGPWRSAATMGTYDDEYGLVALIADSVNSHGAHFGPYQLQCANKYGKRFFWTYYFRPKNWGYDQFFWLCEDGYAGEGCKTAVTSNDTVYCDKTNYESRMGRLGMKTWGQWSDEIEWYIHGFQAFTESDAGECDDILAVISLKEHGAIVAPMRVCCGNENWKYNDSFVDTILRIGNKRILCLQGYRPNTANTDCVPVNADYCANQDKTFCSGFPKEKYDSSKHRLVDGGNCLKYYCADSNLAFPSAGNVECAACSSGGRGGSDSETGVCKDCAAGKMYYGWGPSSSCVDAKALTRRDLMYGLGKNVDTNYQVSNQCWPILNTEEFRKCVLNGGVTSVTGSNAGDATQSQSTDQ